MALSPVTTGNTILASDINQLVNVLQRASGQTETGSYWFELAAFQTNANEGVWVPSLSRGSTPVSVSIDTSITSPAGYNSPTTSQLNANGFWVGASATGSSNTCRVGGNYTIQY